MIPNEEIEKLREKWKSKRDSLASLVGVHKSMGLPDAFVLARADSSDAAMGLFLADLTRLLEEHP